MLSSFRVFGVLCIILSCLVIRDNAVAPTKLVKWVILHYHKTGFQLNQYLMEVMVRHSCGRQTKHLMLRDIEFPEAEEKIVDKIKLYNFTTIVSAAFYNSWDTLFKDDNIEYRIVHFSRNPYDMIMSGYLYHSQNPPPPVEYWAHQRNFRPCKLNFENEYFKKQVAKLSEFAGNATHVELLINNVYEECNRVYDKYKFRTFNKTRVDNYFQLLWDAKTHNLDGSVDFMDGIIMDAAWQLYAQEKPGGGMLHMAVNALHQKEAKLIPTYVAQLEQFPVGDERGFITGAKHLFAFLMPRQYGDQFYTCHSEDYWAEQFEKTCAADEAHVGHGANQGKHTTSGFLSHDEKLRYIQRIKENPKLGPLFDLLERAVAYPGGATYQQMNLTAAAAAPSAGSKSSPMPQVSSSKDVGATKVLVDATDAIAKATATIEKATLALQEAKAALATKIN